MNSRETIVGLVGHLASGKDCAADILVQDYGFSHMSASNVLRRFLPDDQPESRELLTNVGNEIRDVKGPHFFAEQALHELNGSDKKVISGLYAPSETEYLRNQGAVIVAVTAPPDIRYERLRERGRISDNLTYEEFLAAQHKESRAASSNTQGVQYLVETAELRIENNDTIEELKAKLAQIALERSW